MMTTTPKPLESLRQLLQKSGLVLTRAATADNRSFLAPNFVEAMQDAYGGTRLGEQELGGNLLDNLTGALWTQEMIEAAYAPGVPALSKVVIAIDPPSTSGPKADACGIIVAGLCGDSVRQQAIILHDSTVSGLTPLGWAQLAINLFHSWKADYLIAEVNQGGEMVTTVLSTVDPHVPVRSVWASKSKALRAQPVAALYEQGRVKHAEKFRELERELCKLGGAETGKSPDRADALVWAITDLLLSSGQGPQIRTL